MLLLICFYLKGSGQVNRLELSDKLLQSSESGLKRAHLIFSGCDKFSVFRPDSSSDILKTKEGDLQTADDPEGQACGEEQEYSFPENQIMLEFTSNIGGYSVNRFFAEGPVPFFWGGSVEVKRGVSANFQRTVFHGRKIFSFDVGASASCFETVHKDVFYTLSVYPLLRFTLLRLEPFDFYFFYSAAGPTYISQSRFRAEKSNEVVETGKRFTFHDYTGIGIYAGPQRHINAEVKIGHYSNGGLFPENSGLKIPLTLSAGFSF
ncbi:MAG: acyloxyacyl hydrolase [Bacteroidales bacterium]